MIQATKQNIHFRHKVSGLKLAKNILTNAQYLDNFAKNFCRFEKKISSRDIFYFILTSVFLLTNINYKIGSVKDNYCLVIGNITIWVDSSSI